MILAKLSGRSRTPHVARVSSPLSTTSVIVSVTSRTRRSTNASSTNDGDAGIGSCLQKGLNNAVARGAGVDWCPGGVWRDVQDGGAEVPKEFVVGSTAAREHLDANAAILGHPVIDEVRWQGLDRHRTGLQLCTDLIERDVKRNRHRQLGAGRGLPAWPPSADPVRPPIAAPREKAPPVRLRRPRTAVPPRCLPAFSGALHRTELHEMRRSRGPIRLHSPHQQLARASPFAVSGRSSAM